MKLRSLTIRREVPATLLVGGPHHCGMAKDGRPTQRGLEMPVRWTVVIRCTPALDGRGFLLDQAMVAEWLVRLGTHHAWEESCERLVIGVGERLLAKIAHDVPHCDVLGLSLTLSPSPYGASVSATWGAPDA